MVSSMSFDKIYAGRVGHHFGLISQEHRQFESVTRIQIYCPGDGMVDLAGLEPAAERRVGSSPTWGTKLESSDECYGIVNVSKELHR